MAYLNTYQSSSIPEQEYHIGTPLEDYDINFCFPVRPLESNGVRLEPLIPSVHARDILPMLSDDPSVYTYLYNPPETLPQLCTFYENTFRRDTGAVGYAIYDKSYDPPQLAGSIAYIKANASNLCAEVGHVTILKPFQRSHVNTHACSLLIQYALSPQPEGLGLRRLQWMCHAQNAASKRAAERLGFKLEGLLRWDRVLLPGKVGEDPSNDEGLARPERGNGRHTYVLAICWDDWKEGTKEHVQSLLDRPVVPRQ